MRINHNIAALNTYRQLNSATGAQSKSMEKLSSGQRINRAGDDAAGLAISEKMRGQIRGLDMASKNSQDAISLIQTAEGALNETHSILQRMRELAVQSSNDTNTDSDRAELQKEVAQLKTEITRIADNTEFNTKTLLKGDLSAKATGTLANTTNANSITITNIGSLKDADTFDITQKITHAAESTNGANDGVFDKIEYTIDLGGGNTGTLSFSKADLDAGTTSKEVTINGTTLKIDVKDAATLSASKGNGAGTATTADTLTVDDKSLVFHIGANEGQNIKLSISDMSATALNVNDIDISNQSNADAAITTINNAIESVSAERSKLGAYQNRLEHTINNLNTSSENLTAAESRVRDVDYALAA
ncbi:flagellin [Caldifermentibacillus hisashii]|uniref:flagellin N-terminal helical domain-containing protein n=1 Tax=Caldifermentibacillus hisashii TaxID=996558 RepID=UPI0034D6294A